MNLDSNHTVKETHDNFKALDAGGGIIAVFDIGKTNKKFFLLNEQYQIVQERNIQITEISDEDGFPSDNVRELTDWVHAIMNEIKTGSELNQVKAINISAYGASFVNIGENGELITPLYNYLKPYPHDLLASFYDSYGGENKFSLLTASPVLGNLNSGLLLYYLQKQKNTLFEQIKYSLHLPQYISYLISGKAISEITSIGCHTGLWDFTKGTYHDWVFAEDMIEKLAPISKADQVSELNWEGRSVKVGIGLHDSSSALIPYLRIFSKPFVLISTGTWCISMNPFNKLPLTEEELEQDCLCYLTYEGQPVKSSRLFAGNEHAEQVKRLGDYFHKAPNYYKEIVYDSCIMNGVDTTRYLGPIHTGKYPSVFGGRDLSLYSSYEEAYHQLLYDIMQQQKRSVSWVLSEQKTDRIFVDGGFAHNPVYMQLLANSFPGIQVFAATVSQASAIGAALAIHSVWNELPIPDNLISVEFYQPN